MRRFRLCRGSQHVDDLASRHGPTAAPAPLEREGFSRDGKTPGATETPRYFPALQIRQETALRSLPDRAHLNPHPVQARSMVSNDALQRRVSCPTVFTVNQIKHSESHSPPHGPTRALWQRCNGSRDLNDAGGQRSTSANT